MVTNICRPAVKFLVDFSGLLVLDPSDIWHQVNTTGSELVRHEGPFKAALTRTVDSDTGVAKFSLKAFAIKRSTSHDTPHSMQAFHHQEHHHHLHVALEV